MSSPLPDIFATELGQHIPEGSKLVGSLLEDNNPQNFTITQVVLPKSFKRCIFSSEEVEELKILYSKLNPDADVEVSSSFKKYYSLSIYGKQLGSYRSRSSHSSVVMVKWSNFLFNPNTPIADELRPARINYFASFYIKVNNENQANVIVSVSWFQQHPLKNSYGKPLTVWENDIFETNICSLIPIQFINGRTVSLVDIVGLSNALILCPCVDF